MSEPGLPRTPIRSVLPYLLLLQSDSQPGHRKMPQNCLLRCPLPLYLLLRNCLPPCCLPLRYCLLWHPLLWSYRLKKPPPASFPEFPHPTRLAATMDVASNAANTFFFITFSSLSLILFIALYKMCCHILYHLYQNFLRNRVAYFFVNFRFKVNLTPKKAFCQPSIHRSHIFLHFLTDF